jgi:glycosyltransferase involved in cell wall biosynthesis
MTILNQATIAIAPNLRVPKHVKAIPTKLFEYMAAGLPMISSDLPYQVELFSNHRIGILAQPEYPDSFACAIKTLVDNRTLAFELGKNGQRAFVAEYCWESQVPDLLAFYATIIDATQPLPGSKHAL